MSCEHRLQCLRDLKDIGYQTGTRNHGRQSGTDYKTPDSGYSVYRTASPRNDWYRPPSLPHGETPFAQSPSPERNRGTDAPFIIHLPSDASVGADSGNYGTGYPHSPTDGNGGILAGANVVMPNLSPQEERKKYNLYNNKASLGAESVEGLNILQQQLEKIGYQISFSRGDYKQ